jgi:hypothetical protein
MRPCAAIQALNERLDGGDRLSAVKLQWLARCMKCSRNRLPWPAAWTTLA